MISFQAEHIEKEIVDAWFTKWEGLREKTHACHEARDTQTVKSLMEQGITLFEAFILEASDTELCEITSNAEFELMPVNGSERLAFIKMRPAQYACYRQLDELFKETKKRVARLRVKS